VNGFKVVYKRFIATSARQWLSDLPCNWSILKPGFKYQHIEVSCPR